MGTNAATQVETALTVGSSMAIGAAGGSVVPVIGTFIGAAVGALIGFVRDLAAGPPQVQVPGGQVMGYLTVLSIDPELIYVGEPDPADPAPPFGFMKHVSDPASAVTAVTGLFELAQVVPTGPLVDPAYLGQVLAQGSASPALPLATTASQASGYLQMLRAIDPGDLQVVLQNAAPLPLYRKHLAQNVAILRGMAGESGPDPALEAAIGGGSVTPPNSDGALLQAPGDPAIYVVQGGQRHWIPSPTVLAAMGLSGSSVLSVPPSFLQGIPLGASVTASGTIPSPAVSSPAPAPATDWGWWGVAAVAAAAAAVGGAMVWRTRAHQRLNGLGTSGAPEQLLSPGDAAFQRVVQEGVSDGELLYSRRDLRGLGHFNKTFSDARLLSISPTELALSGRYFGEDVLPVRIEVYPTGDMRLSDGRLCYTAAKMAGARAILADVVQLDGQGDEVRAWRAAVTLL